MANQKVRDDQKDLIKKDAATGDDDDDQTFGTDNVFGDQHATTKVPKFGDWDTDTDNEHGYTHIFHKVREERSNSGIKIGAIDNGENLDFGRDTNKLDYFSVTPFDINGDDQLHGINIYGGGNSRTLQTPVAVGRPPAAANNKGSGGRRRRTADGETDRGIQRLDRQRNNGGEETSTGGEGGGVLPLGWWKKLLSRLTCGGV